jgi:hypothetical protein
VLTGEASGQSWVPIPIVLQAGVILFFICAQGWIGVLFCAAWWIGPLGRWVESPFFTPGVLVGLSRWLCLLLLAEIGSGLYLWHLLIGRSPFLWDSEWGQDLMRGLATFVFLFGLRAYHVFRVNPFLLSQPGFPHRDPGQGQGVETFGKRKPARPLLPVGWLIGSFACEALAAVLVLFFSVRLAVDPFPPFRSGLAGGWRMESPTKRACLIWDACKPDRIAVELQEPGMNLTQGPTDLTLWAWREDAPGAPIQHALSRESFSVWAFPVKLLEPPGRWRLQISWLESGSLPQRASFLLPWPALKAMARQSEPPGIAFWLVTLLIGLFLLFALEELVFCYQLQKKLLQSAQAGQAPAVDPHFSLPLRSWVFSFLFLSLFLFCVSFLANKGLKSDFQRTCRRDGGIWGFSPAIAHGMALSQTSCLGCTPESSIQHFTYFGEYRFFLRPAELDCRLAVDPGELEAGKKVWLELEVRQRDIYAGDGRGSSPPEVEPAGREPWQIFIVAKDFPYFRRVSPPEAQASQIGGQALHVRFPWLPPKGGLYAICLVYRSHGRVEAPRLFLRVWSGSKDSLTPAEGEQARSVSQGDWVRCGPYRVRLLSPRKVQSGRTSRFALWVESAVGRLVDLAPCGGWAACGLAVRKDFQQIVPFQGRARLAGSFFFQRTFPRWMGMPYQATPQRFPGRLELPIDFLLGGDYQLYVQFCREEKVYTVTFPVHVEGALRPWWLPANRAVPYGGPQSSSKRDVEQSSGAELR